MWYEILIENEFAEYFINSEAAPQEADERQMADAMLAGYSELVYGVMIAWSFYDAFTKEKIRQSLAGYSQNAVRAFDFFCDRIHLSQARTFHELWRSIPRDADRGVYSVDVSQLTAEQCGALIMYPFFSRMDGSFEKEFQESGRLKKYLLALKSKCGRV